MRVVLDTNVLVSAVLSPSGSPGRIVVLWEQGLIEVIVSQPILAEYARVLRYKHLPISPILVDETLQRVRHSSTLIEQVKTINAVAADPHDDKFIACAVAGQAEYIVSGDEHLLVIKEYQGIPLLSPAVFLSALAHQPPRP